MDGSPGGGSGWLAEAGTHGCTGQRQSQILWGRQIPTGICPRSNPQVTETLHGHHHMAPSCSSWLCPGLEGTTGFLGTRARGDGAPGWMCLCWFPPLCPWSMVTPRGYRPMGIITSRDITDLQGIDYPARHRHPIRMSPYEASSMPGGITNLWGLPCKMSSPCAASSLHVTLWDIVTPWGRHPGRHHPMEHHHPKGHHNPMGTSPYWTSSPQKSLSPHKALPPSGLSPSVLPLHACCHSLCSLLPAWGQELLSDCSACLGTTNPTASPARLGTSGSLGTSSGSLGTRSLLGTGIPKFLLGDKITSAAWEELLSPWEQGLPDLGQDCFLQAWGH